MSINQQHSNYNGWLRKLIIYYILGSEYANLVNEYQLAGKYETKFNAADILSRVYFYRLTSCNF